MTVPTGGISNTAPTVNHRDRAYPLVCVCETPEPEWVYVANQYANCKRIIVETAS